MQAGYTPILGGSMREWGSQRDGDANDIDDREANRLYLDLTNSGNTAARNLRIWSGIDYETSAELEHDYHPAIVPLRRTSNTSWWQVDQGGAIAPQHHETTEFQANPKLKRIKKGFRLFDDESTLTHLHTAFEQLEEAGIGRVEVGFVLKYTSTTGAEEMISIGAYEADLANLEGRGMRIHYAQENKEEKAKEIYNRLN